MWGDSKARLVETLDYFGVNRVEYYKLHDLGALCRRFPPDKRFGLRSIKVQGAKFYYAVTLVDVLGLVQSGEVDPAQYVACDSMKEQDATTLIMNGEVQASPSRFSHIERAGRVGLKLWEYSGILNRKKGVGCRYVHEGGGQTVQRWRDVPPILLDLIWTKQLPDYVIEFSLYTEPVGCQNSPLLIWEIRKY